MRAGIGTSMEIGVCFQTCVYSANSNSARRMRCFRQRDKVENGALFDALCKPASAISQHFLRTVLVSVFNCREPETVLKDMEVEDHVVRLLYSSVALEVR